MKLVLDEYQPSDARACARVMTRAWNAGHPHALRHIGLALFEQEMGGDTLIVARTVNGDPVGFVGVFSPDRFIHHLYVDPAWSGQGIGKALLDRALALAGGTANLKCQIRNEGAIRFYEREGWTRGEQGESDGEPWIRMHSPVLADMDLEEGPAHLRSGKTHEVSPDT